MKSVTLWTHATDSTTPLFTAGSRVGGLVCRPLPDNPQTREYFPSREVEYKLRLILRHLCRRQDFGISAEKQRLTLLKS